MFNLRRILSVTATATLIFYSLAASSTVLAQKVVAKPVPTEVSTPAPESTVSPTELPAETPAPQPEQVSPAKWVMTHKKISLGVLAIIAILGYYVYQASKKSNGSEETKENDTL